MIKIKTRGGKEIIVTKKTKDAFLDTAPNDKIVDFNLNTFKILAKGKFLNQAVNADPTEFFFEHGFPFIPNFYAYCRFPDGTVALAGPFSVNFQGLGTTPGTHYGTFTPEIDATKFYFTLTRPGSNYNVDIIWRIFEVPIPTV